LFEFGWHEERAAALPHHNPLRMTTNSCLATVSYACRARIGISYLSKSPAPGKKITCNRTTLVDMRINALALSALALLAITCDRSSLVNSKVLKSNQKLYNWDASEGVWKFAANSTQPINIVPVDFEPLFGDLLPSQLLSSLRPGVPPAFINERSIMLVTQCGRLAERVWIDGPGWKWQYHGFLPGGNSTIMRVYPHGLVLTAGGSFGTTLFQHFPEMQNPPSTAMSTNPNFASSPEPAVWVGGLSYMLSNGSCMPVADSYPSPTALNQSPISFQPSVDDLLARYPNLWLWSRRELDPGHVIVSIGPQFSSYSFLLLTANQTLLFVSSVAGQAGGGTTLEPYAYVTVPPEFPLRFISDFVNWNFM
jgi:hypothetical protein